MAEVCPHGDVRFTACAQCALDALNAALTSMTGLRAQLAAAERVIVAAREMRNCATGFGPSKMGLIEQAFEDAAAAYEKAKGNGGQGG